MSRPFIVTTSWDDGHVLDLKVAKLLRKHGLAGTFYLSKTNKGFQGQEWWQQLSEPQMIKLSEGFEIGSHTMTHPELTKLTKKEATYEIEKSKLYLEKLLDRPVETFCYPKGLYTSETVEIVKNAGYIGARTVDQMCDSYSENLYEMGTTLQIFPQPINYNVRLALKNNPKYIRSVMTRDWEKNAIRLFDRMRQTGGIYHLWSHSWAIERYDFWDGLDRVFAYIANCPDAKYLTMAEVIKQGKNDA